MEADLEAELHHHLDLEIAKNVRAGMPLREARRKAMVDFGGLERFKEQTREARASVGRVPHQTRELFLAVRPTS